MPTEPSPHRTTPKTTGRLVLVALLALAGSGGCASRTTPVDVPSSDRCDAAAPTSLTPATRTEGPWIGSSKSAVIRFRGRPDQRRGDLWLYEASPPGVLEVLRFSGPRVVSVSRLPGAPACKLEG